MTHIPTQDLKKSQQQDLDAEKKMKDLLSFQKHPPEQNLQSQLHKELAHNQALQNECEELRKQHQEELQALRQQQIALREILKKSQNEVSTLKEKPQDSTYQTQILSQQQKIQQLERVIPYLRERTEEAHLETDQLREELEKSYQTIESLQTELTNARSKSEKQPLEVLTTNPLTGLIEQKELDKVQKQLFLLEEKNRKLTETLENNNDLQEKYEQLKEESNLLTERLESALDTRLKGEQQLEHLGQLAKEQEATLIEQHNDIAELKAQKENLNAEVQQLRKFLEENENNLKLAQQHLAKKVKESALLAEKLNENQRLLAEQQQRLEISQGQLNQMQINIETYQRQEKKLQEQLHNALKSTESQVTKWEEKYFKMYDKWQESEVHIRELKKIEEKYQQMQGLLANLGTVMGASVMNPTSYINNMPEFEKQIPKRSTPEHQPEIIPQNSPKTGMMTDERCDVFGMKLPHDKIKYTSPHE